MNLLNDCTDAQDVEKDMHRQRLAAGKLNTLHNATIQAMSNLLSANIDSGLMHSIGKG
jgi:neurofibromin 1